MTSRPRDLSPIKTAGGEKYRIIFLFYDAIIISKLNLSDSTHKYPAEGWLVSSRNH